MRTILLAMVGFVLIGSLVGAEAGQDLGVLIQQLTGPRAQVTLYQDLRSLAAVELAALGNPAVEPLIAVLGHKEPEVRRLAAWTLGEIGDARATKALVGALKDQDGFTRDAATEALRQIGQPAVEALIAALSDRDARVRELAARALGSIRDPRATEKLTLALGDGDPSIRYAAAWALGQIKDGRAMDQLVVALKDQDHRVRRYAAWALAEIGEPAVKPLVGVLRDQDDAARWGATEALAGIGEPAVPLLIPALTDENPLVRRHAGEALWKMRVRDRRALDPLIGALKDQDALLRRFAAGAIGVIGDRRAVNPLLSVLKDEDSLVRSLAVEALGRIADAQAVPALAAALKEEDIEMRRKAAEALGRIGQPALEALIVALRDQAPKVRQTAAIGLGQIKDDRVVEPLIAALQDPDLQHPEWQVRLAAAQVQLAVFTALGNTRDRRAIELLINLLEEANRLRRAEKFTTISSALETATGRQGGKSMWEECLEGWKKWWAGDRQQGEKEPGYREAMEAGRQKYVVEWSRPIDFAAARREFAKALPLAATDQERAEALLAIGKASLSEVSQTNYAAIREEYAKVLALKKPTPEQRAEAHLGIAETYLRAKNYQAARKACTQAAEATAAPVWAARTQMLVARSYLQERDYPAARRELAGLLAREGLEEQLKWEARALVEAVHLIPRVRTDHPRLFFNAETWPAVKERALTVEQEYFAKMKEKVEQISLDQIEVADWGSTAMEAAFVYRVTGEPAILEKVTKMLRATLDHYLRRIERSPHSYSRVSCIAALDWVWNDLTPSEREALAADLLRYVGALYVEDKALGLLARQPVYYWTNMYWYAALLLLNPQADDVAYARAATLLGIAYRHQQEDVGTDEADAPPPGIRGYRKLIVGGDDGAWHLNIEYSFGELPTPTYAFMHTWRSATGAEIPEEWLNIGVPPDFALRMVVGMGRGHVKHFNYAGSSGGVWGFGQMRFDTLYDHLGQIAHFFGQSQPEHAAVARYLRNRIGEEAGVAAGGYPVSPFLMTGLENAPPVLPENLPIARHFENVGLVLMSSGFGPHDTYALFAAGGGMITSHDLDTTHFSIYRKGYLALDTGARFAQDHQRNYRHQTVAHNAVLIRMEGESFPRSASGDVTANTGGQNRNGAYGKVLAFETDRLFAYTATDATPIYHEDKCAQMVRQFIFLPSDHFVVFDRVTSKQAGYPKTWLLHTSNEPVITGKEFRADQDQGRIFCRTLYPLDAALGKIGGRGKEFWTDGRNWPIPEGWWRPYGRGHKEPPEAMGRWRVEVKPGQAREQDYFLHLIQTSDQTVEKMVGSKVSETANRVQLTFTVGARTYTIALNKTGEVGGHIRITEGRQVLVDRDLTREIMPQAGLALTK